MNIIKEFINVNKYSRPNKKLKVVKGIVIHNTGNPGTTASQNRDYFNSLQYSKNNNDDNYKNDRYASTQFIVDDNKIVQTMEDNEVAYHCGAYQYMKGIVEKLGKYPNHTTIGIEVCHPDKDGKPTEATLENLSYLLGYLLKKYSHLDVHRDVYRHFDITGKNCPKYYVENPNEYIKLKTYTEENYYV